MGIIIGGNNLSGTNLNTVGDTVSTPNMVTDGLVLFLDAGNNESYINSSTNYYDCGYGCQYYSSNPGCTNCNTQWKDLSGYGNDGTIRNSTPITYNGSGGSFVFSASNHGITISNSSSLTNLKTSQGGSGLTVLIWAKSTGGVGSWRKLIGNGDGDNYIDLYQNPSGYWHQDGSGESLFVDGVSVANDTYYMPNSGWHQYGATNLNSGTLTNPTQLLTIGNEYNLSSYPWVGEVSIVQIYNRVLSSSEILQNFNNGRQRFGI